MSLRAKRGNLIAPPRDCFGTIVPRNDRVECHSGRSEELCFVIWTLNFIWHLSFDIYSAFGHLDFGICDLAGITL